VAKHLLSRSGGFPPSEEKIAKNGKSSIIHIKLISPRSHGGIRIWGFFKIRSTSFTYLSRVWRYLDSDATVEMRPSTDLVWFCAYGKGADDLSQRHCCICVHNGFLFLEGGVTDGSGELCWTGWKDAGVGHLPKLRRNSNSYEVLAKESKCFKIELTLNKGIQDVFHLMSIISLLDKIWANCD